MNKIISALVISMISISSLFTTQAAAQSKVAVDKAKVAANKATAQSGTSPVYTRSKSAEKAAAFGVDNS